MLLAPPAPHKPCKITASVPSPIKGKSLYLEFCFLPPFQESQVKSLILKERGEKRSHFPSLATLLKARPTWCPVVSLQWNSSYSVCRKLSNGHLVFHSHFNLSAIFDNMDTSALLERSLPWLALGFYSYLTGPFQLPPPQLPSNCREFLKAPI